MVAFIANRRSSLQIAVFSRLLVFFLQLIANVAPDHKADAFNPDQHGAIGYEDWLVRSAVDGFHKWDAKYIIYISEHGYSSENMFAFFPLLPLLSRWLAEILLTPLTFLSFQTCCILSATLINFIAFNGAALALFDLTYSTFKSPKFAFLVTVLFSFNPASIFFSSAYTESLFAFLVFKGLLAVSNKDLAKSSMWFVLSAFARSNGIINIGFIAYFGLCGMLLNYQANPKILTIVKWICKLLFLCLMPLLPFIVVNLHGYIVYCTHYLWKLSCLEAPKWCCDNPPSIYNHIQKNNWGLGLFEYYTLRKVPNFLLATPTVVICVYGTLVYMKIRSHEIVYLGLPFFITEKHKTDQLSLMYTTRNIFCYAVHTVFLVMFALLFMHVEVVTRMIMSSTPFPYWIAASLIFQDLHSSDVKISLFSFKHLNFKSKVVVLYFLSYLLLGTILHVNFLPWT